MLMINGSDNQPFAKAVVFADDVNGNSTGAGRLSTRERPRQINIYLARTWDLSQVRERADKKQILRHRIVLSVMLMSSAAQVAQV